MTKLYYINNIELDFIFLHEKVIKNELVVMFLQMINSWTSCSILVLYLLQDHYYFCLVELKGDDKD